MMSLRRSLVVLVLLGATMLGLVLSTQFQFEAMALQTWGGDPGDLAYPEGGGGGGGGRGFSNLFGIVVILGIPLLVYLAYRLFLWAVLQDQIYYHENPDKDGFWKF